MQYVIGGNCTTTLGVRSVEYTPKSTTVEDIKLLVSDVTGIAVGEYMSGRRDKRLKQARWLVWEVMYALGYSLQDCARATGHDHTTVLNGLGKIVDDAQHDRLLGEWRYRLSNIRAGGKRVLEG